MMLRFEAVVALFPDLPPPELRDWIARGWVRADGAAPEDWLFAEVDIARIHLIRDLRIDLAVEADTLPLVLSLLDQLHGLRRTLRTVGHALQDQPEPVRRAVLAALTGQDTA